MTDLEELAAVRKVMSDRGWLVPESPPLSEAVGVILDLLEGYQKSQELLRTELHNLQMDASKAVRFR